MINVDVAAKSKKWQQEKDIEKFIEKTCQKLILETDLKKICTKNLTLELAVSLVSDQQIKKINSEFRNKNKATDVLSFSTIDEKLIRKVGLKEIVGKANYLFLGDIVISYETTKKESLVQKKSFYDHLTHLILHSVLHLIGHDHEKKNMAKIMEDLEIKILKKFKIPNPYEAR